MSEFLFSDEHGTGAALNDWWAGLQHNKGDRAELRRCATVLEVVMTPAYHRVYRLLVQHGLPDDPERRNERIPVIVALVAQIKDKGALPRTQPLAKVMSASPEGSNRPSVSPSRFRRLLTLDSPDDLLAGFRRVLPLIEGEVRPQVLAQDLYYWGDRRKRAWAYAYDWPVAQSD